MTTTPPLILASSSTSRARLLTNARVPFIIKPAHVDEDSIKQSLKAEGATALNCAETLAEMKAVKVSRANAGALVIGADQMLVCEERWFDKPVDLADAAAHLRALSGKTHTLPTAVIVALNGARIWHFLASPRLVMRAVSEDFIAAYLRDVGDSALSSVGAYQLEGLGAQLFRTIEGDFFTILGLPLLRLLAFLREHRVVPS